MKYKLTIESDNHEVIVNFLNQGLTTRMAEASGITENKKTVVDADTAVVNVEVPAPIEAAPPAPETVVDHSTAADSATDEITKFDARGFAWDERIHASSKAAKNDGTWRYRRGVDQTVIDQVEAEMKAASAPVPPAPAEVAAAPVPPAPAEVAPAMPPVPAEVAPAMPPVPAELARTEEVEAMEYDSVMSHLTGLLRTKVIAVADLSEIYRKCGVEDLAQLQTDNEALSKLWAEIKDK